MMFFIFYVNMFRAWLRSACYGLIILISIECHGGEESLPAIVIPHDGWRVVEVSSQQAGAEAAKAIDGDPETYWHSKHGTDQSLPQAMTIDLGQAQEVCGFSYLPRPDGGNGAIETCDFLLSPDGVTWTTVVTKGKIAAPSSDAAVVRFAPQVGVRFVRLVALTARNKKTHWASMAELEVYRRTYEPPAADFTLPVHLAKVGTQVRFRDTSSGAPSARVWHFPGGKPDMSTEAEPEVVYLTPGRYSVRLESSNANGRTVTERTDLVQVLTTVPGMAVWLDGRDNELLLGMGIMPPPWTIELWAKGDGDPWRRSEVLIGAGQYADVTGVDPVPLELANGHPSSALAGITAPAALGDGWHHLALTCDGRSTVLYVDGQEQGRATKASSIIPGALGNHINGARVFGGGLDEVRIWNASLEQPVIAAWRQRSPTNEHPQRAALRGWWSFDDLDGEISRNKVGTGPLPYHMRNGRFDYYGASRPLAYPVVSDNPAWESGSGYLFNATVVRSEWPVIAGSEDVPLLKVRVVVEGNSTIGSPTGCVIDLSGCSQFTELTHLRLSHKVEGTTRSANQVLAEVAVGTQSTIRMNIPSEVAPLLTPGIHTLLLSGSVSAQATPGHLVKATIREMSIGTGAQPHLLVQDDASRAMVVHPSLEQNPNILRVLSWNIWHGGRHLGPEGPRRILDLLRASRADLITMQESYGSQELFAKELGYHLHTTGARGNLAIFSRFPIRVLPTKNSGFKSLLVEVVLPNARTLLLANWWLPYASYADGTFLSPGHNTKDWVLDDERLSTADARLNIEKDILPNWTDRRVPLIIGGDFNSGSHLDWTQAAAPFHGGYGPVLLPTSLLMKEYGFSDSFRIRHPDETQRPDGSFAVVYGQLQFSRIDYIYHHGLTVVDSDIIRTSPEIDTAWASDHAAVLTVFRLP